MRAAKFVPLVLLLALPACAPKPPSAASDEPKPVPVTVADAKPTSLRRTVTGVGTLYPYDDILLAPRVGGKVVRTYKEFGERVGPGKLLLELDDAEYRLAVEQAESALDAELRKLKLPALSASDAAFEKHLATVDAVVEARANLALAESDLELIQQEFKSGVGARQRVDTAVNRVTVAKTRVQLAETDARVTLANARRLKALLDDAKRKLAETKVYAPNPPEWQNWIAELGPTATPLDYAVAQKMVSAGSSVEATPATNCYRLVIDHALKLIVAVPERHAPEVKLGQPVEVRVGAHPGKVFAGVVARISPTTDTASRAFAVVVGVRNGDHELKAGGFADAEIAVGEDPVDTIPPEALVQFAGVNKVFAAEGNRAKVYEVEVVARHPDRVDVKRRPQDTKGLPADAKGLPPGAKVITSGQSQLVDGSPIRVK